MLSEEIRQVVNVFENSNEIGLIEYQPFEKLQGNQVMIKLAGTDKRFKVTIEECLFKTLDEKMEYINKEKG